MAIRYYRVVLDKRPDDAEWSSVFPELGVASCGSSVNEALRMALDAAAGWLEVTVERGQPVPDPMPLDAPLPDWMTRDEEIDWSRDLRVLVPVDVPEATKAA